MNIWWVYFPKYSVRSPESPLRSWTPLLPDTRSMRVRSRMRHLVPQRGNTVLLLARVARAGRARLGRGPDVTRAAASRRLVLARVVLVMDMLDVGAVGGRHIRDTSSAGGVTVFGVSGLVTWASQNQNGN